MGERENEGNRSTVGGEGNQENVPKTGQIKKGFQPRTTFCKKKNGEITGNIEDMGRIL
jgi:hypothetical protein